MSKRPNPDYVDRCIDYISSRRRRLVADLTLGAIVLVGVSFGLVNEIEAELTTPAGQERRLEVAKAEQPCTMSVANLVRHLKGLVGKTRSQEV